MKLRQRLFWRKFLPVWGIVGILLSLAILIIFGVEDIYKILQAVGTCTISMMLSATIGWKCSSTHHWIPLSISMAVAFCGVIAIRTVIAAEGDISWAIMLLIYSLPIFILPCVLLILIVNYLLLRKNLSD